MVCTANDLSEWKDFPKGLRVLLLDEDSNSATEIKSKLEAMDYVVSIFCNESEALSAISKKQEIFHVAIVEVTTKNPDGSYKFLESAKDLPIIMTSDIDCLSTMMKCIALGAVEFLQKPLSEEKLRNIWQHVVHKAFNAGGSLKPVKESFVSMLPLELETEEIVKENSEETDITCAGSDKYPAPSTPQLKQGARLVDDGDCHDQTNSSMEKEDGESNKSVETTSGNSISVQDGELPRLTEIVVKLEDESGEPSPKNDNHNKYLPLQENLTDNSKGGGTETNKASSLHNSSRNRANRKKMKVDWTTELHKKFVQAVDQLGIDQAIPSRILELMKVEGLTRHNVASHLQKYRMHRRHILPKEENRRWSQPRERKYNYQHNKPIMAFPPPYQTNHPFPAPAPHVYPPMWGPPTNHMWGNPGYPTWQPGKSWHWPPPYPAMHADTWGCPVMPPPPPGHCSFPQNATGYYNSGLLNNSYTLPEISSDSHLAEEVIDKVVKEAVSKPWLPLPLGLKPPSTDIVLSELSKQGISTIPPPSICH
ncbi:two-component response regulator-like APRR2 [Rutidosis leptorrhynchoides]|uniref:two-component response regulator-like APRR2 n=1 Tax=Rutidosis leptorrhynchoides TaxID=125765 RepID=UPI003A98FCFC